MSCPFLITHSVLPLSVEKRLSTTTTISALKTQFHHITGTPPNKQRLILKDPAGLVLADPLDEDLTLGDYPISDLCGIHIVDVDPSTQLREFEDVSQVEKYQISEEDYRRRDGTFLKFKQAHPELFAKPDAPSPPAAAAQPEATAANIHVGDRCQVRGESGFCRRGVVKFVGTTRFKPGEWVGVCFDEPVGKHDGSVKGVRYFSCPPNCGSFFPPAQVEVGDFPEVQDWDEDDVAPASAPAPTSTSTNPPANDPHAQ
ncbi:putative Tubulin-folding cofactor B [Paratrimastix pyriformis]|uniref:Tubulin-folding cofactor B n=1 Tax=Paratrimastix pyriformis TaxID=342808 RepID=A0ABQ8V0Z0_9EUKA|nr:putative Tubulin-folding cofactor B [Paratrimastix pyriformis]|eukprot:GAFH01004162.1.p1 GENE.GAFH01004162.1~~GAFH01004162.1.p1  ORF type:complete len:257 (-),score=55.12 GAFH01004162.1:23-793(-)